MNTNVIKKICTLSLLSLGAIQITQAQDLVQNKYLVNPELAIEKADSSAKFWFDSVDQEEGAFFTNVARNGQPSDIRDKLEVRKMMLIK